MEPPSDFRELRRTQRLLLTPKGEISDGGSPIKTLIRNISRGGMLLACDRQFRIGQKLKIKFQALGDDIIHCEVEVRHSSDSGTGVEILSMGHEHRRAFHRYLDDYIARRQG
jgi:hypothetical protein